MWNGGAMLTNRYAPRDATILALGMAKQDFGETKDKGLYKFETLEPVDTSLRTFTYAITTTGEKEQVVSKTKAEGLSFNVPLQAFYMNKTSKGAFKDLEGSIVSVNNTKDEKSKNVFLTAFKQAEDWVERKNKNCEYYVLRLKEYEGTKTEVNINTMFKVKNAWIASALEEPESELKVEGGKNIPLTVDPRDTVTILMEVEKPGSSFTSTATGKAIIALFVKTLLVIGVSSTYIECCKKIQHILLLLRHLQLGTFC